MIPITEGSSEPNGFVAIAISDPSPKASSSFTTEIIATAASKAKPLSRWFKKPVLSRFCRLQSSNCQSSTTSRMEPSLLSVSSEAIGGSMSSENILRFPRPLSTATSGLESLLTFIKSRSTLVKSWLRLSLISYQHGSPLTSEQGNLCIDTC